MTDSELADIMDMHTAGRCMPFVEFVLANGTIMRFQRMADRYVCVLRPTDANMFLERHPQ